MFSILLYICFSAGLDLTFIFHFKLMYCFKSTELDNKCLNGKGLILRLINFPEKIHAFKDNIGDGFDQNIL